MQYIVMNVQTIENLLDTVVWEIRDQVVVWLPLGPLAVEVSRVFGFGFGDLAMWSLQLVVVYPLCKNKKST